MTNTRLSTQQITDILMLVSSQNGDEVISYINKILSKASTGLDTCARPLAIRSKDDQKHECFAVGYLEKIHEFICETDKRCSKEDTIKKTIEYINKLIIEIGAFFTVLKGGFSEHSRR